MSALLNLLASLVKFLLGKLSKKSKQKEIAKDEGIKAVDSGDTSDITSSFDKLR